MEFSNANFASNDYGDIPLNIDVVLDKRRNDDYLNILMNDLATEQDEPEPFPCNNNNEYTVNRRYDDTLDESGRNVMNSSFEDEKNETPFEKNFKIKSKQIEETELASRIINKNLAISENPSFDFDNLGIGKHFLTFMFVI
jgi:hypothetical protein